ncbi:uncharacterized protein HMPREF1541_01832 [Cyphellophora europaea CBS 101466]|uniref:Protein kinase domain-containing protein n=1 Tax=Cyphellophora europaea (strain CBS 101466) TaxID=1220924 RepID=W2S261_CYPE1|nr:uncharacterized protein HMPREF1541_01832 [Cyphellophora europaea CBS 101466]ETN42675.1 hypothetical protein HMPREF1541_01832 [Cyphellophora europaea CBS 101466]
MGIRPGDGHPSQRPVTPEPQPHSKHSFRLGMWQRLHGLFSKDDHHDGDPVPSPGQVSWPDHPPPPSKKDWSAVPVGVGLPRQATFRRQNSEKRDRLTPVLPSASERRAVSSARAPGSSSVARRPRASSTPPLYHLERTSAPAVPTSYRDNGDIDQPKQLSASPVPNVQPEFYPHHVADDGTRPPRPYSVTSSAMSHHQDLAEPEADEKAQIKAELDTRWILNLSMHFRDKSDREKFFVTYAETPNKWRRVTVSCDYRNAEPGSLEMDLKELQFQRDKSLQIYESIRDSLLEIQFYDTVTNLKLETSDGRLHVHVTEDVNECIQYPPRSTVAHILYHDEYRPQEVRESELDFDSHLSGFVYKVVHEGRTYIKKEIPGPDTVDEFLYEINALHALHESANVIRLEAIVVDDTHQLVKGLLISYAEQGAIVDLLYDYKGKITWEDRLRWARDSVVGLSEIHEEGYVQGDFTLSNIVVDREGNAKIIDINRRGCPVGWEPPEIAAKIESHQRISMYIGEKSDLYQLGMTLWGLAADDDEPERHDPPLSVHALPPEVPDWYKDIIRICLDPKPRNRRSAKELAALFPAPETSNTKMLSESPHTVDYREQKRYINPKDAVERDDIERFSWKEQLPYSPESSRYDDTFTYPRSSNYDRGSDISEFERPRGRPPPRNLEHLSPRERHGWLHEQAATSQADESEPQILAVSPRIGPQYDELDIDGRPFLIARGTFDDDELEMLDGRPRGRSRNQSSINVGTELDPPSSAPFTRPANISHNSTTSGSTPRHSQAVLPTVSGSRRSSLHAAPSELTSVGSHPDIATEPHAGPTLQPLAEEPRFSQSPQPPPSLTYADSGFYEPVDEEDMLPQPSLTMPTSEGVPNVQRGEDESSTPLAGSVGKHATAMPTLPPLFERSDTSIHLGKEQTCPLEEVQRCDSEPPIRPTTPAPSVVVHDVDGQNAYATTLLEAQDLPSVSESPKIEVPADVSDVIVEIPPSVDYDASLKSQSGKLQEEPMHDPQSKGDSSLPTSAPERQADTSDVDNIASTTQEGSKPSGRSDLTDLALLEVDNNSLVEPTAVAQEDGQAVSQTDASTSSSQSATFEGALRSGGPAAPDEVRMDSVSDSAATDQGPG